MNISLDLIKKLREETLAGVSDCRQALEEAQGDYAKAKIVISQRQQEKAEKKAGKETGQGLIDAYIHNGGKVGVLLDIRCETDFVARNEEFRKLSHEIALQVAALDPKDVPELLDSAYIRDASQTISQLIKQTIAKTGENITVNKFIRFAL